MLNRRKILWLGVLGVLALVALAPVAIVSSQLTLKTTFNSPIEWVPSNFPERVGWSSFSRRFQLGDQILVSWPGATLDDPTLEQVAEAIRVTAPEAVKSAKAGAEIFQQIQSEPWNKSESEAFRLLQGSVVGPDQKQTLVIVELTQQGTERRIELVRRLKQLVATTANIPIEEVRMIGIPVEGAAIDTAASDSIARFAVPSALIAIAICWICLRSFWLTISISSVAMIGQGVSLGAVLLTGQPMNAILIVLPPLVFVLTVSAGIHLSNYFLEAASLTNEVRPAPRDGDSDPDPDLSAVAQAFRAGLIPCILATATTIFGLGSLVIVPIVPVRNFGILSSISIGLTMLLLLAILPATMLFTAKSLRRKAAKRYSRGMGGPAMRLGTLRAWIHRVVDRAYHLPVRNPFITISLVTVLGVVFAFGLKNMETSVAITSLFAPDHPMRKDYKWFETMIGPSVVGELQLKFSDLSNSTPIERLRLANSIHTTIAKQPDVSGVLSPGVLLPFPPRSNSLMNRPRIAFIATCIQNIDPQSPLALAGLMAKDGPDEFWRISYRVPLESDIKLAGKLSDIEIAVQEVLQQNRIDVELTSTGGIVLFEAAQVNLLNGLLNSFITAFAVVAIVMMFLLRSVLGGCMAMIPNALPTLVTFGFLGLTRTPLDIGAVMTASLALGIAVDDTVHLLSRFANFRSLGHSASEAALAALRQCGPAMAQTTFVCGMSLMVYIFSDFLPTRRFSLLMVCLLTTAIIGDLFLLPALLSSRLGEFFARPMLTTKDPLLEADAIA